jgi:hypothetical protein
MAEVEKRHPEVGPGGKWTPADCHARHKVALIVPYRDRYDHLKVWLDYIHPFLQRQNVQYQIFLVEQVNNYSDHKYI